MDRLTAMETFVHVVETGSFSAAAKRLGIGQPAVSKSVAQLEARLAFQKVAQGWFGVLQWRCSYRQRAKPARFKLGKRLAEIEDARILVEVGQTLGAAGPCTGITNPWPQPWA